MATPLTDAINALTSYANGITGKSDANLPDAVRSLADGYGGGSGGLEYEEGTYIPETDGVPTIFFANQHNKAPNVIIFADVTETGETGTNRLTSWSYIDYNAFLGSGIRQTVDTVHDCSYIGTRVNASNVITYQSAVYTQGKVTSSYFKTYMQGADGYNSVIAGRTYKWIAIWK